jgi:hypothetical protein
VRLELAFEEPIRETGHHSRSVACAVGRPGTAMVQSMETLHTESHDPMRCNRVSVRDEPDTTGIVVLQRVVERESVHVVASVGSVEGISCE